MIEALKSFYIWCVAVFTTMVVWLVKVVGALGYPGIFIMMAIESSFFPLPSEVVMPPAGYLAAKGEMNMAIIIICGTLGSIVGATVNYMIAKRFGRKFLIKFSKYLMLNEQRINYMDNYFKEHGEIITFIGRLIPVVRHYISFPAGLARMNYGRFAFYTGLGAFIWVTILAYIGHSVGNNIDMVKENLHTVMLILFPVIAALIVGYVLWKKQLKKKESEV